MDLGSQKGKLGVEPTLAVNKVLLFLFYEEGRGIDKTRADCCQKSWEQQVPGLVKFSVALEYVSPKGVL